MTHTTLPVLISGGGISGLTLACALRHHGIACDLVEARTRLTDAGGVGLTLVGNALRALASIGLAKPVVDAGMPADHVRLCTPAGRLIARSPSSGPWGEGIAGHCSMARSTLHGVLVGEAQARGARLITGRKVLATRCDKEGVEACFDDGSSARYLLWVAAEGLASAARQRLFPDVRPTHSGQGSWRARVARPPGLTTSEIYLGGRYGVVGVCPISNDDAYLYIVESAEEGPREDETRWHLTMRQRLEGHYGGHVPGLLPQLTDPSQVSYRPLPVLLLPAPWHKDGALLIGDAAHANPPVLAQGAAMGIEDAVVLAEELAGKTGELDHALARFMARRFERVKIVVESSAQLARWEVEHRNDVDVAGMMAKVTQRVSEPI